jgi:2-polyprenyl-3-methyl-5-hydroxy-6-metoxy-1,4-benzoquinol methylase
MSIFAEDKAAKFSNPTQLPEDKNEREKWLEANKSWWEKHPMRYDWLEKIDHPEFSKEFYQEIDRRFFEDANKYLPIDKIPFDAMLDFESLNDKKVLEIGVGNGSHAQLLATHAKEFTGIDLTDYAIKSVSERMKVFGLDNARIIQMNAEELEFEDNSFDFVWSWGVVHHSANTQQILNEINRVLKPGGTFKSMVYYRSFWSYYVFGVLSGIFHGHFFHGDTLHEAVQKTTDGAIARYYSASEWQKELTNAGLILDEIVIMGMKSSILPIPGSSFKYKLLDLIPDKFSRYFTNNLEMGSFLTSTATAGSK